MDDTDIRGLSAEDAKAYALEFMTALKGLERDLAVLGDEAATWAKRVELAAAKGSAELEAAARAKLDELAAKRAGLEAERVDLAAKVARIREKLPMAGASERSVDPDLLLANLRMATGQDPDDEAGPGTARLESDIAALGADDALAALKRKIEEKKRE
ncbi:MAG: chromosome partitioning protein [Spirochaetae bacterium HGW-Spirochaetae-3]|jgi:hypothetical protein|nr:MAG: chromosome partitioning protein [Spirochaetae bacterium HGW-Spirochaetae-3]